MIAMTMDDDVEVDVLDNLEDLEITTKTPIDEVQTRVIIQRLFKSSPEVSIRWIKDFITLYSEAQDKYRGFQLLKKISENLTLASRLTKIWPEVFHFLSKFIEGQRIDLKCQNNGPNHQAISLIHRAIQVLLVVFKNYLSAFQDSKSTESVSNCCREQVADLMIDLLLIEVLPIDIKCNITLLLCYAMDKDRDFYLKAFKKSNSEDSALIEENDLQKRILNVLKNDYLRILFAFGIFGTNDDFDGELYHSIGKNILDIDQSNMNEMLILSSVRVIECLVEILVKVIEKRLLNEKEKNEFDQFVDLFPKIECSIFLNISIHIDTVRIVSRNSLAYLANIYDKLYPKMFDNLLLTLLSSPPHVKWISFGCIARKTPKSIMLLELEPDLPNQLLAVEMSYKQSASDAYISLMKHHHDLNIPKFQETWLDPLFQSSYSLQLQQMFAKIPNWYQKRMIIHKLFKTNSSTIKPLLKAISTIINSPDSADSGSNLIIIEIMKIGNDLGYDIQSNEKENENYFKGIIPWDTLDTYIIHRDPQVRLAAFSILVETKKTSGLFELREFETIKMFLKYNIFSSSPAFRQEFSAIYKKLIKRINDGRNLLKRKRELDSLAYYDAFLKWLWTFLTQDCLFKGANFGRRYQSNICLQEFILTFNNVIEFEINSSALEWFEDTYENNKVIVLNTLSCNPPKLTQVQIDELIESAFESLVNIHPPESVTGKYLIQFLVNSNSVSTQVILDRVFNIIESTYNEIINTSLMKVATRKQIYGSFGLLRMMFKHMKSPPNPDFVKKLFELGFKMNSVVFPILSTAAPEETEMENQKVVRSINSQILLVFSWRTMKEIGYFLTETCSLFEIETEGQSPIVTLNQIEQIGTHLLFLLMNLMHRGVFEQISVGFKNLAHRMWSSKSNVLNALTETWLQKIDENELADKCITRRSSGLPFIYISLIATTGQEKKWIEHLFAEKPDLNLRIHTMNVLRGLFRDADYSNLMIPFVPQGIQLAFQALKSSDWNIRNSGLMFYGSIIRRTFGPKLNLMSCHMFFKKFPNMYSIIIDEFENLNVHSTSEYTYHLLLLLSCFVSSSGDRQGIFDISRFIPLIRKCTSSPDLHVRKMGGKAIVPFIISVKRIDFLLETLDLIKGSNNNNAIHGLLIQFNNVLNCITEAEDLDQVKSTINCSHFFQFNKPVPLIFEELAKLSIKLGFFPEIEQQYEKLFSGIINRNIVPGLPKVDIVFAQCKLSLLQRPYSEKSVYEIISQGNSVLCEQLCVLLIDNDVDYEYSEIILEIIIKRYLLEVQCGHFTRRKCEFQEILLNLILHYVQSYLIVSTTDSKSNCTSKSNFKSNCNEEVEELIYGDLILNLVGICTSESGSGSIESIKFALGILTRLVFDQRICSSKSSYKNEIINLMLQYADPIQDDSVRYELACAIPPLELKLKSFSCIEQSKIWLVVLKLAQDDCIEVRERILTRCLSTSTCSSSLYCEQKTFEILLELFYNQFVRANLVEGCLVMLLLLFMDQMITIASAEDDQEEDRLFERSELNSFKELPILVKSFSQKFPAQIFSTIGKNDLVKCSELFSLLPKTPGEHEDIVQIISSNLDDHLARELISSLFTDQTIP